MQRSMKACKGMAFWDIYKKKGDRIQDITVGLRCPYWETRCNHREHHEGKVFCNNQALHEDIRREWQEKDKKGPKEKEPKKAGPEPDKDEPAKKAA